MCASSFQDDWKDMIVRIDPGTGEAPGKIPHVMGRAMAEHGGGMQLPPLYFGTVDATAMWICLLHDAWCW